MTNGDALVSVLPRKVQHGIPSQAAQDAFAPAVSIIIVNHNGKKFLHDCLSSVANLTLSREAWEVVLVDNGSNDGSVELVRERFPWVRLVETGSNLGFARGNNEGLRCARGRLIALLNNDTVVQPSWLGQMIELIDSDSTIGAVTAKILFRDKPHIINSAGLNLYSDGRGGDRGFREPDRGQFEEIQEVFGACGASVLLRREMLDDVGGFDERFFVYYEDLDLAWRARRRGWKFLYAPKAVVYHVHCGTSGEWSPFFVYHVERNRVFVSLKNAPWRLVIRSLAVFAARAARKWLRVLLLQERTQLDRGQAIAYVRAAFSLAIHAPEMLCKRLVIRMIRAKVSDRRLARLIVPPPSRLALSAIEQMEPHRHDS